MKDKDIHELFEKIKKGYKVKPIDLFPRIKRFRNFYLKWCCSTNHKEIGTMYIFYGAIAGIIGSLFSVFIRMELAYPGMQFFAGDYQFYNVVITAHGLIMIFFMLMPALISGFGN